MPGDLYTQLKARLLQAHSMTNYQKMEKLSQFPLLGAQKPFELMATMLKLCPQGQKDLAFFTFFYLCRLSRKLQVLLNEEDFSNRRAWQWRPTGCEPRTSSIAARSWLSVVSRGEVEPLQQGSIAGWPDCKVKHFCQQQMKPDNTSATNRQTMAEKGL
jgi:hypothetical protein